MIQNSARIEAAMIELRKTAWFRGLPDFVQVAVEDRPPFLIYRVQGKKLGTIYSYEEHASEHSEDRSVMFRVDITQDLNADAPLAMERRVFGLSRDDLEAVDFNETAIARILGQ